MTTRELGLLCERWFHDLNSTSLYLSEAEDYAHEGAMWKAWDELASARAMLTQEVEMRRHIERRAPGLFADGIRAAIRTQTERFAGKLGP